MDQLVVKAIWYLQDNKRRGDTLLLVVGGCVETLYSKNKAKLIAIYVQETQ